MKEDYFLYKIYPIPTRDGLLAHIKGDARYCLEHDHTLYFIISTSQLEVISNSVQYMPNVLKAPITEIDRIVKELPDNKNFVENLKEFKLWRPSKCSKRVYGKNWKKHK